MGIMKNLMLIYFLVINLLCCRENSIAQIKAVDADSVKTLMKNKNIVILDVRTPEEFTEGHLKGSVNIDYRDENFEKGIDTLKKYVTYVVYCRSGRRSEEAGKLMSEKGFKKIYHYHGGILDWEEKKNELVK